VAFENFETPGKNYPREGFKLVQSDILNQD